MKHFCMDCILQRVMCELKPKEFIFHFQRSLRSKRFRLVSEQRNTGEGDFRYGPREK